MKKLCSIILLLVLTSSLILNSYAAEPQLKDVPAGHWAEEAINALNEGGLVRGYPDGRFGIDDYITIDQMATLICNIKGLKTGAKNGYWAYGAIEQCMKMEWLEKSDEITANNYGVPCTRELAIDMFMKSCNVASGDRYPVIILKASKAIPDYFEADSKYRTSILQAYRWAVIKGIDSEGSFAPKKYFYRTELVTILYRTGYIKAAEAAAINPNVTGELTNLEAFEEIKSWGIWNHTTEEIGSNDIKGLRHKITTNDERYGRITVEYDELRKYIVITMFELAEYKDDYLRITSQADVEGISRPDRAKLFKPSSYADTGRDFVARIVEVIAPNSKDTVLNVFRDVMMGKLYEIGKDKANAMRWLPEDNRGFTCEFNSNYWYNTGLEIEFFDLEDVERYEFCTRLFSGSEQRTMNGYVATMFATDEQILDPNFDNIDFAAKFYGFDDKW